MLLHEPLLRALERVLLPLEAAGEDLVQDLEDRLGARRPRRAARLERRRRRRREREVEREQLLGALHLDHHEVVDAEQLDLLALPRLERAALLDRARAEQRRAARAAGRVARLARAATRAASRTAPRCVSCGENL